MCFLVSRLMVRLYVLDDLGQWFSLSSFFENAGKNNETATHISRRKVRARYHLLVTNRNQPSNKRSLVLKVARSRRRQKSDDGHTKRVIMSQLPKNQATTTQLCPNKSCLYAFLEFKPEPAPLKDQGERPTVVDGLGGASVLASRLFLCLTSYKPSCTPVCRCANATRRRRAGCGTVPRSPDRSRPQNRPAR
jgi:hypothetical protein